MKGRALTFYFENFKPILDLFVVQPFPSEPYDFVLVDICCIRLMLNYSEFLKHIK